jgi:hypothetical protein
MHNKRLYLEPFFCTLCLASMDKKCAVEDKGILTKRLLLFLFFLNFISIYRVLQIARRSCYVTQILTIRGYV